MSETTTTRSARPADLLYTETENELRGAVRAVLADKAGWHDVLARTESGQTYDDKLWRTLAAEVGIGGLLIPESLGGAGAPTAKPPSWPRNWAAPSRLSRSSAAR